MIELPVMGSGVSEKNSSPERREERKRRGKRQERQRELSIGSGYIRFISVLRSWVVHRRAPAQHEAETSVLGWYNRNKKNSLLCNSFPDMVRIRENNAISFSDGQF